MSGYYEVFLDQPDEELKSRCETNCVGQYIAWRGTAEETTITRLCEQLAPHANTVRSFVGADIGRMVHEFIRGKRSQRSK